MTKYQCLSYGHGGRKNGRHFYNKYRIIYMRFTKFLSIVGFVITASIAATTQAQSSFSGTTAVSCNWGWLGGGGIYTVNGCFVANYNDGQPIVQRTTGTNGYCSITATAPGVVVSGTCLQPIIRVPSLVSSGQCGSYGNYDQACWDRAKATCPSPYRYFSTYIDGAWTCHLSL